ncbi:dihydrofolate reductase family protein [Companilactobacillus kimchii]|uniref:Dihydrofolate reductase n=2 Tax=Companilactobacillus kimchii TaxID=2801452 RepID=A0ABR5NVN5_9LACO|nr:dihydrofolate reductase family protein [Companilactobacillus kimchii]KAE9558092.1 dihydrofolate reductase [Companilactobacillus kimchii]KRK52873.1 dihydrofolate reductase [Companilactobacillus kimchii DSM 13961 = JCM 10707]OWF33001.1 Dihydrofolate reductase [Companilactobacillus kimchii]GEO46961.1 dihydrofolate reductase [Companilactobacillus paralimentarius]
MTRKVILFIAETLDGYIAEENGNIDYLIDNDFTSGEDNDREYEKLVKHVDSVVMGRKTYDQVANKLSPDSYPYDDFDNYIMTRQPIDDVGNLHFVDGDIVDLVKGLKNRSSNKDIWIIGGSSIIAPLVNSDLIDVYQIGIVPIILGKGIPLFSDKTKFKELNLISAKKVNGIAYLEYSK